MATILVTADDRQSKHQFTVETTADVATTTPANTEMGLLFKTIAPTAFNQQQFIGLIEAGRRYAKEQRIVEDIRNGGAVGNDFVNITITRDGAITDTGVATAANPYTAPAVDTVTIIVPTQSDWIANGSTSEFDAILNRLIERFLESYGKLN